MQHIDLKYIDLLEGLYNGDKISPQLAGQALLAIANKRMESECGFSQGEISAWWRGDYHKGHSPSLADTCRLGWTEIIEQKNRSQT